ncbi:MAG TPA: GAF domain-containing protein, partial [Rhodocyclaceae bacterium]|nr:GAF domain-containing protein [Rhodocyclaceae bacterium]
MNAPLTDAALDARAARFDRITRVAAMALISPIALLSLIDESDATIRLVSVFGTEADGANAIAGELGPALLRHALAIDDARLDTCFHDAVAGCSIGAVAYCNVPLLDEQGAVMGSLCVIDTRPRQWSAQEAETLQDIAMLARDALHAGYA